MLLVSKASARFVTADDPARGFLVVAFVMMLRMMLAFTSLALYALLARPGLVPFGTSLVVAFLAILGLEAVRSTRPLTLSGSSR
jgi:hypothetical protein